MGNAKVDLKQLEEFRDRVQKAANEEQQRAFMEACAKELAARLLAKVIKRTPVGDYSGEAYECKGKDMNFTHMGNKVSGKTGGTLRRGWTTQAEGSGAEGLDSKNAVQFVDTLKVNHFGDTYVIEVRNSVEYASYIEFGHRKSNHKGWVPGHYMLTMSEKEIRDAAPDVLRKKLNKWLNEVFA